MKTGGKRDCVNCDRKVNQRIDRKSGWRLTDKKKEEQIGIKLRQRRRDYATDVKRD